MVEHCLSFHRLFRSLWVVDGLLLPLHLVCAVLESQAMAVRCQSRSPMMSYANFQQKTLFPAELMEERFPGLVVVHSWPSMLTEGASEQYRSDPVVMPSELGTIWKKAYHVLALVVKTFDQSEAAQRRSRQRRFL